MDDFKYDSYCGIYCGACEIMRAYRTNTEGKIAAQWGATPEEIQCRGCKTQTVFKNCGACRIRECAIKRDVEHCVFCSDFPCETLTSGESLVERLPHLKAIPRNMQTIQERGMDYWLHEQKAIWRCPDCGEPFSWYQETCSGCSRDIRQDKDYLELKGSN